MSFNESRSILDIKIRREGKICLLISPLLFAKENCESLQPPASVAMFGRLDIWKALLSF